MTGLPAKTFGLKDRGVLREGAYADITVFDPKTVAETATWEKPIQAARGIDATIVNGAVVWRNGRSTGRTVRAGAAQTVRGEGIVCPVSEVSTSG